MGLTQSEVKSLMQSVTSKMRDLLMENTHFVVPNLGTFSTRLISSNRGFNPHLNSFVQFPPKQKIHFKPSKVLRDKVKSPDESSDGS